MAIAGLVFHIEGANLEKVSGKVKAFPDITEVKTLESGNEIAAVLECSSVDMQQKLKDLGKIRHVIQVDVAYINYEDDIEKDGFVSCPPLEKKRKHKKPEFGDDIL